MFGPNSERDQVEVLAEEFGERQRRCPVSASRYRTCGSVLNESQVSLMHQGRGSGRLPRFSLSQQLC